ncbi:DUF4126 domain-containing protein [Dyella japonica]|uniref:Membrane protein n=1 Tax=Dyella japonica A8 TaxID=1217721 RepID=A0A075K7C1_9GAMM|nr:DUF4126 domain-containing protein [Dyella japonica]AIF49547.1 membrane protein [Dyella japonica A8]
MDTLQNLALAGGLSWASGFRLYATVFIAGLLGRLGYVHLPDGLQLLTDTWVLVTAGVLSLGEFLADKVPAFDSVWDAVHTFIRVPAGALLAWGVFRDAGAGTQLAAALLGGTLASGTHLAKTGGRALINTSPEPFSNWGASLGEDISWLGGMYLMWQHPAVFLVLLGIFVLFLLWLVPKILRGLRTLARKLRGARPESSGA